MKLAVLPGDGIGPEVVEVALNVTKAVCEKFRHTLTYEYGIVGACAIAIEIANSRTIEKTKKKSSTRILPDVKVRKQYGKPYHLVWKYNNLLILRRFYAYRIARTICS